MVLLSITVSASAQITAPAIEQKPETDQKYLAGAVAERDGHVYLTRTLTIPAELTQQEVMQKLQGWMDRCMKDERISYHQNLPVASENELMHNVIMELTFSQSFISHDFANLMYLLHLTYTPGQVVMDIDHITYKYREADQENKYTADELISDHYAINKKGRLVFGYKKFRIKTIDLVDELFTSLQREFQ